MTADNIFQLWRDMRSEYVKVVTPKGGYSFSIYGGNPDIILGASSLWRSMKDREVTGFGSYAHTLVIYVS